MGACLEIDLTIRDLLDRVFQQAMFEDRIKAAAKAKRDKGSKGKSKSGDEDETDSLYEKINHSLYAKSWSRPVFVRWRIEKDGYSLERPSVSDAKWLMMKYTKETEDQ